MNAGYRPVGMDSARVEAFWRHVDRSSERDDCWEWTGRRHPRTGHGKLSVGPRQQSAHRIAYELSMGPVPLGMLVMHTCDNPPCCNPAHLRLGTQSDLAAKQGGRRRRSQDVEE